MDSVGLARTIKTCDVNVVVIVAVIVIAPVIVAALVNGNDAVAVIDAVERARTPGDGAISLALPEAPTGRAVDSTDAEGRPDQVKHVTIELLERIGAAPRCSARTSLTHSLPRHR